MHYSPLRKGFAAVALVNPKSPENIGAVMRAVACYDAALVVLGGPRPERLSNLQTDTVKAWRHIPHIVTPDIFGALPHECIPIAVELVAEASPLHLYRHPDRAFYVFGAEDATLDPVTISRCRDVIYMPTNGCMNLAAAVNVVLYDRLAKALLA